MRCHLRRPGSLLLVASLLASGLALSACGGRDAAEAGGVGTSGEAAPFDVEIAQTYVTLQNRTGTTIAGGEIAIVPAGILPPFRASLARLESSGTANLMFDRFRGNDGTGFRRGLTRARTLRITATDISGRTYEQEVPFR